VPTIAIMTDFGIKDGNVGVMKGVIWGICPEARIADVSHMIGAQNVREAALILARSAPYFPPGTVQLVVVDPGVGTTRRPLAAKIGTSYYVGPDNGIITSWLEHIRVGGGDAQFVQPDRQEFWRKEISHVFHGRDIFAPVAAHLAAGVPLQNLGSVVKDPVLLDLPKPRRTPDGLEGEIIHIDHFGNIASNIMVEDLGTASREMDRIHVLLGPATISGLVDTFGDRPPGEMIALFGSTGNLIISVVNGSAAARLGLHVGEGVRVLMPNAGPEIGSGL
jgi:S-adenosyl-L-methionine hydrolase (adenosine-forming)